MKCIVLLVLLIAYCLGLPEAGPNALDQIKQCPNPNFLRYSQELSTFENVPCASVCPPEKTADLNVRYCQDNCPERFSCLLEKLLTNVTQVSEGMNVSSQCSSFMFFNMNTNNLGFFLCSHVCSKSTDYCKQNCKGYVQCMLRLGDPTTRMPGNITTQTGRNSTLVPVTVAVAENSPLFIFVLLILLVAVSLLSALIVVGVVMLTKRIPELGQCFKSLRKCETLPQQGTEQVDPIAMSMLTITGTPEEHRCVYQTSNNSISCPEEVSLMSSRHGDPSATVLDENRERVPVQEEQFIKPIQVPVQEECYGAETYQMYDCTAGGNLVLQPSSCMVDDTSCRNSVDMLNETFRKAPDFIAPNNDIL